MSLLGIQLNFKTPEFTKFGSLLRVGPRQKYELRCPDLGPMFRLGTYGPIADDISDT